MKILIGSLTVGLCLVSSVWTREWVQIAASTEGFIMGFHSLSDTQTWACASSGYIYFYDGSTWSVQTNVSQGKSISLQSIHAVDSEHVWAAGYEYSPATDGHIYFYDGNSWSLSKALTNAGEANRLYGIYAADTSQAWACGENAQVWHTPDGGTTWTTQYDTVDNKIWSDIDGVDAQNVWACGMEYIGENAQIIRYNGSTWATPYSSVLGDKPLRSISAISTNNVWAIGGTNGYVLHYQNSEWTPFTPLHSTNANTYAISGNTHGEVWASVFGQGKYYLDGTTWIQDTSLNAYPWRIYNSPWQVWVFDSYEGVNMLDQTPSMDRIASGIGFSWDSVPGRTYQVEWADSPLTSSWKQADLITSGGWITYWGDIGDGTTNRPAPTNIAQRTYRIVESE